MNPTYLTDDALTAEVEREVAETYRAAGVDWSPLTPVAVRYETSGEIDRHMLVASWTIYRDGQVYGLSRLGPLVEHWAEQRWPLLVEIARSYPGTIVHARWDLNDADVIGETIMARLREEYEKEPGC
jgi:hypothetical protein